MTGPKRLSLRRKFEPREAVRPIPDFATGDVVLAQIPSSAMGLFIERMNFEVSRRELPHQVSVDIDEEMMSHQFLGETVGRSLMRREYRASVSQLRLTGATQFSLPLAFGHSVLICGLLELGAKLWIGYKDAAEFPVRETHAYRSWFTMHGDSFIFFIKHQTEGALFTTCLVALADGSKKFVRMGIENETAENVNKVLTVSEFYRIANTLPWGSQL